MSISTNGSSPEDRGVRYERVDAFTVNMYVDGPGDTTVRPSHPAVLEMSKRDREQIAQIIARIEAEHEKQKRLKQGGDELGS